MEHSSAELAQALQDRHEMELAAQAQIAALTKHAGDGHMALDEAQVGNRVPTMSCTCGCPHMCPSTRASVLQVMLERTQELHASQLGEEQTTHRSELASKEQEINRLKAIVLLTLTLTLTLTLI